MKKIVEISFGAMETPEKPLILFVNGFTGGIMSWFGYRCFPFRSYWSEGYTWQQLPNNQWKGEKSPNQFIHGAKKYFGYENEECNYLFLDGSDGYLGLSRASQRFRKGIKTQKKFDAKIWNLIQKSSKIGIVTHSMGAAFAEGLISGNFPCQKIIEIVHFATADASAIKIENHSLSRIQLGTTGDTTIELLADPFSRGIKLKIPGVRLYGRVAWDPMENYPKTTEKVLRGESKVKINSHFDTKSFAKVFDWLNELKELDQQKIIENIHDTRFEELHINGMFLSRKS